ncbi:hypothetical protein [Aeromonas veronii]|uniref:hypothetical protein n=1 Tax=Aeromonas veronii TaxID=654 RepID=UPI0032EE1A88
MNILCRFANAVFIGENISDCSNGSWRRDRLNFHAFGYEIEWVQHPEFNASSLSKNAFQFVDTSFALVKNVTSILHLEESMKKLAFMLSFALNSQVTFYSYIEQSIIAPSVGKTMSVQAVYPNSPSPLSTVNGSSIRVFIETCWERFDELYFSRRLNIVIDYFTTMDAKKLQLEVKLSLAYTLLECLKFTFAKNDGYPFNGSWFLYKTRRVRIPANELISRMLSEVGMVLPDQLMEERNNLVHEGITSREGQDIHFLYSECKDIVSEYLLRLLGFSGTYFFYRGRGIETKEI